MPIAIAVHRIQNAKIIRDASEMWKELAGPDPGLPVLLERPSGLDQKSLKRTGLVQPSRRGNLLSMIGRQLRFVIPCINMRNTTRRIDEDHSICCWRKMSCVGCERIDPLSGPFCKSIGM
jgi:hypothetical protein